MHTEVHGFLSNGSEEKKKNPNKIYMERESKNHKILLSLGWGRQTTDCGLFLQIKFY